MKVIPQFPSTNIANTKEFYTSLGFQTLYESPKPDPFLIMLLDTIELHFWSYPDHQAEQSNFSCYVRFEDHKAFDTLYKIWQKLNLPKTEFPRLTEKQKRIWGMEEFYLVDCDGHLLKFGIEI